jgi:hypothetical protein
MLKVNDEHGILTGRLERLALEGDCERINMTALLEGKVPYAETEDGLNLSGRFFPARHIRPYPYAGNPYWRCVEMESQDIAAAFAWLRECGFRWGAGNAGLGRCWQEQGSVTAGDLERALREDHADA